MATRGKMAVKDEPTSPPTSSYFLDEFEDRPPPNKLVRVDPGNQPRDQGKRKLRRKILRKECLDVVPAENTDDGLTGNRKGKRKSARNPSLAATETVSTETRKIPLRGSRRIAAVAGGEAESIEPCRNLPPQPPAFEVTAQNFEGNGILGNGKGTVYPKYEVESQYNFIIPEPHQLNNAPWKQSPILPPEGLKPTILSVVGSVSLGEDLDLKAIADSCLDLIYNPQSFAPLVMRLRDPTATAMVFNCGKMTVSGAKSVDACKLAIKKFTAMIRSVGFNVKPLGMLIQNISATFNVGFKIRLRALARNRMLTPHITYDPDSFSGVAMALPYPKANVMVFRTGSGMIQGITTCDDLDQVFKIIYPHVKMYAI